jgi:hypothetical protein
MLYRTSAVEFLFVSNGMSLQAFANQYSGHVRYSLCLMLCLSFSHPRIRKMLRALAALTLVVVIGNGLLAQQNDATAKVGDHLFIQMTGDLAKEYAQRSGSLRINEVPDGLQIETSATIAQKLNDGRIRIEHTSHLNREGGTTRLVTLTATVDPTNITTDVTPKGTPVFASPGAKGKRTTEDTKTLRLKLSDLKGLKLRTWTLSEEIGD